MKKLLATTLLCACVGLSFGQVYSDFQSTTFTDLTVNVVDQNNQEPHVYEVEVGGAPTLTIGGQTCEITGVSGFYNLAPTASDTFDVQFPFEEPQNNWNPYWSGGSMQTANVGGWQGMPAMGAGDSDTFTYMLLSPPPFTYGFQIEYDAGWSIDTAYFRSAAATPEPLPLYLGFGVVGIAWRRRAAFRR